RLLQNHEAAIEPPHCVMAITDGPCDLVQRNPVVVVDTGDVLSLGNGIPILGTVNVLEADVLPEVLPLALNYGKSFEFLLGIGRQEWDSRHPDSVTKCRVEKELDRG